MRHSNNDTSSSEDVNEVMSSVRSSEVDNDVNYDHGPLASPPSVNIADLAVGQFIVVKFDVGLGSKYYVGKLVNCDINECEESPFQVSFLRQSKRVCGQFVYPQADDISDISPAQIIAKLAEPSIGRRGQLSFGIQLTNLDIRVE